MLKLRFLGDQTDEYHIMCPRSLLSHFHHCLLFLVREQETRSLSFSLLMAVCDARVYTHSDASYEAPKRSRSVIKGWRREYDTPPAAFLFFFLHYFIRQRSAEAVCVCMYVFAASSLSSGFIVGDKFLLNPLFLFSLLWKNSEGEKPLILCVFVKGGSDS